MTDKVLVPTCPVCGERVTMFAIWDSGKPGEPTNEKFWGESGTDESGKPRRAILCHQGAWVHFRVNEDNGRLAYLKRLAT